MSTFWSIWISVITIGTIIGCYALLRWCLQNNTDVEEGEEMHHAFDGIVEVNNQLPRWWTIMFYVCIVWSFLYFLLYPGLGNFKGVLEWKSSNQDIRSMAESKAADKKSLENGELNAYVRELQQADERFGPIFEAFAKQNIETLATDKDGLKVGQRLFIQNCAQCHGSDARGQRGFPDLTDKDWLYGGSAEHIKQSIMEGRIGAMPAWKESLGENGVEQVVAYTLSLSGRKVNQDLANEGKAKFAVCAACHGQDGKGNQGMGAPDLTDNIWLYGGSHKAVTETVSNGRNGVMPAWKDILGEEKVHVISAYVYGLSQGK